MIGKSIVQVFESSTGFESETKAPLLPSIKASILRMPPVKVSRSPAMGLVGSSLSSSSMIDRSMGFGRMRMEVDLVLAIYIEFCS